MLLLESGNPADDLMLFLDGAEKYLDGAGAAGKRSG